MCFNISLVNKMKKKTKPPSCTRAFVVANIGDEVDSFCQRSDRYEELLFEYDLLSERALFWPLQSDLLVASQLAIPEEFVEWVARIFKKKIKVLAPPDKTQPLFEFLSEKKQIEEIRAWVGSDSETPVSLVSYSFSEKIEQYVQLLSSQGIFLDQRTLPTSAFEGKRRYFSSKFGFKSILETLNQNGYPILGSDYAACTSLDAAYSATIDFLSSGRDVIVKPTDGNSGLGALRFYASDLSEPEKIREQFESNTYLQNTNIMVEELLRLKPGELQSPSVEIYVPAAPEKPYPLYWSQQILSPEGNFLGVVMDHIDPNSSETIRAEADALAIASFLQKEGYRGHFDMDCVIREDGRFIPIEINIRRTGGTHVYSTMKSLYAGDMDDLVIISREEFRTGRAQTWEVVREKLHDLFISADKKTGMLPININMLEINLIGFIVIESTLERAFQLQDEIRMRLMSDLALKEEIQVPAVVPVVQPARYRKGYQNRPGMSF